MKSLPFLIIVLLTAPSIATADIDLEGDTAAIYAKGLGWKIKFPSQGWELVQEKRRPNGGGYYYHLTNRSAPLNFSVFLDKTDECDAPDTCRDLFWSNPGPKYEGATEVEMFNSNGLSLLRFYIDKPMGYPIVQSNISAHSYIDGFWIDIHLSKVSPDAPDYTAINKFIDEIIIE